MAVDESSGNPLSVLNKGPGVPFSRSTCSHPAAYALTHKSTGLHYVGSTGDLYTRIVQHKKMLRYGKHKNGNLQKAYDEDPVFSLSFVETETKEDAVIIEQTLLDQLKPKGLLFNIAIDAVNPNQGLQVSDEVKERLRDAAFNQFSTPQAKKQHSDLIKKKWQDEEYRNKHIGVKHSDERVAKNSQTVKALWQDPEYRKKMMERGGLKISIDGVVYNSIAEAARLLGISEGCISYRCKSPNFQSTYFHVT